MFTSAFRAPPRLPGSYIVRDAEGDILYWGDTPDLYETWCTKQVDDSLRAIAHSSMT